jgi:hypothetical protein
MAEGYGLDRRTLPQIKRQDIQQRQSTAQSDTGTDHHHYKP